MGSGGLLENWSMRHLNKLWLILLMASCQDKVEHFNPPMLIKNTTFSQVVEVPPGRLIFLSGQVALDNEGNLLGDGFEAQLSKSLENVKQGLCVAETDWKNVIQLRIYVVDLKPEHRFIVGKAIEEIFEGIVPPANTLLGIQSLAREDLKVEIEAIAIKH